jgi:hypothetical protein
MKVICAALLTLCSIGCVNNCRDSVYVYAATGTHYNCNMVCTKGEQPEGYECRCTRACSCFESHPAPAR